MSCMFRIYASRMAGTSDVDRANLSSLRFMFAAQSWSRNLLHSEIGGIPGTGIGNRRHTRSFLSVCAVLLHWSARPPYDVSQKSNFGICAEPHRVVLLPLFSTGKACLHIWQDIPEIKCSQWLGYSPHIRRARPVCQILRF